MLTYGNNFLMPIDPTRALSYVVREVNQFATIDPDVGRARDELIERLGEIQSEDDLLTFASLWWLWLRPHMVAYTPFAPVVVTATVGSGLGHYFGVPPALRVIHIGLAHGTAIRQAVSEALDSTITPEAVHQVVEEARRLSEVESVDFGQLNRARDELTRVGDDLSEEVAPLLLIGAGVVIGIAVSEIYHHHIAHE